MATPVNIAERGNPNLPAETRNALRQLRAEWEELSYVARAERIEPFLRAGLKLRALGRELHVSEKLIRKFYRPVSALPDWRKRAILEGASVSKHLHDAECERQREIDERRLAVERTTARESNALATKLCWCFLHEYPRWNMEDVIEETFDDARKGCWGVTQAVRADYPLEQVIEQCKPFFPDRKTTPGYVFTSICREWLVLVTNHLESQPLIKQAALDKARRVLKNSGSGFAHLSRQVQEGAGPELFQELVENMR
jgi:hypothetical protein